jgi:hypothetical protein
MKAKFFFPRKGGLTNVKTIIDVNNVILSEENVKIKYHIVRLYIYKV